MPSNAPENPVQCANHTCETPCRLAPVAELKQAEGLEDIPPIRAQYFYSSPITIDDPLSAPAASSAFESGAKGPLRPFSAGDNNALERAWLSLASEDHRENHGHILGLDGPSPTFTGFAAGRLMILVEGLVQKHSLKHATEALPPNGYAAEIPELAEVPACCVELLEDASTELRNGFCALTRKRHQFLDSEWVVRAVMERLNGTPTSTIQSPGIELQSSAHLSVDQQADTVDQPVSPGTSRRKVDKVTMFPGNGRHSNGQEPGDGSPIRIRRPTVDDGILGKPFVRPETEFLPRPCHEDHVKAGRRRSTPVTEQVNTRKPSRAWSAAEEGTRKSNMSPDSAEVTVGVSRLHMVSLPVLQMRPIYWSPVNDIVVVVRATWFYQDSMAPVEASVANQLEVGYRELKPWTETWSDELRSALEVGALGEEKVTIRLWPEPWSAKKSSHGTKNKPALEPRISSDAFCAARCFRGEAAAEGNLEPVHPGTEPDTTIADNKSFPNHCVVYKDACSAFLLKPTLQPSAYYGRRPVSKIMKGLTVGIPVVRGFDRKVWERLHNQKPPPAVVENPRRDNAMPRSACPGCEQDKAQGQVTDLCFVIHGIGQKLAERVESFHFTHAINTFRRAITIELARPATKAVLRDDHKGIMVLPINWRHALRMEDGGPMGDDDDQLTSAHEMFGLKDIEPNTIKAVRSLISDIMFDIPLYMSHHKPKMIAALIGEANRVYRLWCRLNPEFKGRGRVHLIGHSLGSAMALDVLSRQPSIPPVLDMSAEVPNLKHFEFDTTNLFLLGSPAGFFLLLERCSLVPRRGRSKPGADASDIMSRNVVGDMGTFGCLAVDNVYNILAKEDPIAYLLNAAIDPVYAASLETAFVPSTATSLFKSVNDTVKSLFGFGNQEETTTAATKRPSTVRLPSQLELEVHDFSREEVAEKKAFLLNDNGQIDYYLHSGGGPLEIQYLNMLTAHTSYWSNEDLIRFVCVEIGRAPGKKNALLNMRAVKSVRRKPAAFR